MNQITALLAAIILAITVSGCVVADAKEYDISPIFPLSADKCERYNGEEVGEGPRPSCFVTKADCERAASDWNQSMAESGVRDAIRFTCD